MKAEDRALERFPVHEGASKEWIESHLKGVCSDYIEGYHQAEKDLELTWKDFEIIHKITYDESRNVSLNKGGEISKKEFYQEVLNRFNKQKEDGKIQD